MQFWFYCGRFGQLELQYIILLGFWMPCLYGSADVGGLTTCMVCIRLVALT